MVGSICKESHLRAEGHSSVELWVISATCHMKQLESVGCRLLGMWPSEVPCLCRHGLVQRLILTWQQSPSCPNFQTWRHCCRRFSRFSSAHNQAQIRLAYKSSRQRWGSLYRWLVRLKWTYAPRVLLDWQCWAFPIVRMMETSSQDKHLRSSARCCLDGQSHSIHIWRRWIAQCYSCCDWLSPIEVVEQKTTYFYRYRTGPRCFHNRKASGVLQ